MRFVPRDSLPHERPTWVPNGALYFVTIGCAARDITEPQLTMPHIAVELPECVTHYHRETRWFARLFLLMPDHIHALLAFPQAESVSGIVRDWKRYTARQLSIK